jgi:hypothetical protein
LKSGRTSAPRRPQTPHAKRGSTSDSARGPAKALLFDSFANRSIVLALFNTWGFNMDDVKPEQAIDAMGAPPEAPKPAVKKVGQAAKKVARKVGPKKVGKKAKKSAKKSAKKAPKTAKAKKKKAKKAKR